MDLLKYRIAVAALLVLALSGCKPKVSRPIAGLHSASAALLLRVGGEKKPLAVGSRLKTDDRVIATGPAMLEYFPGGAVRFLSQGDELEVGDALEAKLLSQNMPSVLVKASRVLQVPPSKRPFAARYTDTNFTPMLAIKEPGTGDYLRAFFTPHGIEKLAGPPGAAHEGPREALPAPPFRPHVPHIHAGELGVGGPVGDISGGSVAAETDDFATALLLDGGSYDLGLTDRVFVPKGVSVTIHWQDYSTATVEGPAEVHLH